MSGFASEVGSSDTNGKLLTEVASSPSLMIVVFEAYQKGTESQDARLRANRSVTLPYSARVRWSGKSVSAQKAWSQ